MLGGREKSMGFAESVTVLDCPCRWWREEENGRKQQEGRL
jgi:hypothetical protein